MQRRIVSFYQDDVGDWAARLDCGHGQHTRHNPPFTNRPWVQTDGGRAGKIGVVLDCLKCDRLELPDGFESYRRTPEFDQDSVPAGLTREHRTKVGVWGRLHVLHGHLRYLPLAGPFEACVLRAGETGLILPDFPHQVAIEGPVRFYVEFLRQPDER